MVRARPAVRAVVVAMLLCLGPVARPLAAPFFAAPAPAGTPRGDGTRDRPWDLATALSGGRGRVQPGDTIWLRGGTYTGNFDGTLTGTSAAPIVVRQYPGERATIDGNLHVHGAYAIYWGFEITQSNPAGDANDALDTYGPNCRFINLVVHDAGKQGISFWENEGTSELYGSIFYNNGTHENFDHGIYAASEGGEKWIVDNVVFDNLAYGIHVYAGSRHPFLSNVHVRGNYVVGGAVTLLMAGWVKADVVDNEFVGSADMVDLTARGPLAAHTWRHNTYGRDPAARAWHYQGSAYDLASWEAATGLGRTGTASAAPPTTPRVFVRPNKYEPGRATIVVYNWGHRPRVSVDVSSALRVGARFELRNVQDLFGPPVLSGAYAGGTIEVPMGGVELPRPVGRGAAPALPSRTGPTFDVFILTSSVAPMRRR